MIRYSHDEHGHETKEEVFTARVSTEQLQAERVPVVIRAVAMLQRVLINRQNPPARGPEFAKADLSFQLDADGLTIIAKPKISLI